MIARAHHGSYKCPGTIANGVQHLCDARDTYPALQRDAITLYFRTLLSIN
jgi:hypothetical protein